MGSNFSISILVDCTWNQWVLGTCSASCGIGTRTDTRTKSVDEESGGICIGESSRVEVCNAGTCLTPGIIENIY